MTHLWMLLFLNAWLKSEAQGFGINLIKVPDDDRAQIMCTAALLGKYFHSGESLSGSVLHMSITSAAAHVQQELLHTLHTHEKYPWTLVVKDSRRDYDSSSSSQFVMHEKPQCYFIVIENMEDEDMDEIFENWKSNLNWNPLAQFVVYLSAVEETEEEMTDIMIEILLNFMNKKIYNVNVIGQSEESSFYYGKTVFPYHPDNNCGNRVISIETLDICEYQESEKEEEDEEEDEEGIEEGEDEEGEGDGGDGDGGDDDRGGGDGGGGDGGGDDREGDHGIGGDGEGGDGGGGDGEGGDGGGGDEEGGDGGGGDGGDGEEQKGEGEQEPQDVEEEQQTDQDNVEEKEEDEQEDNENKSLQNADNNEEVEENVKGETENKSSEGKDERDEEQHDDREEQQEDQNNLEEEKEEEEEKNEEQEEEVENVEEETEISKRQAVGGEDDQDVGEEAQEDHNNEEEKTETKISKRQVGENEEEQDALEEQQEDQHNVEEENEAEDDQNEEKETKTSEEKEGEDEEEQNVGEEPQEDQDKIPQEDQDKVPVETSNKKDEEDEQVEGANENKSFETPNKDAKVDEEEPITKADEENMSTEILNSQELNSNTETNSPTPNTLSYTTATLSYNDDSSTSATKNFRQTTKSSGEENIDSTSASITNLPYQPETSLDTEHTQDTSPIISPQPTTPSEVETNDDTSTSVNNVSHPPTSSSVEENIDTTTTSSTNEPLQPTTTSDTENVEDYNSMEDKTPPKTQNETKSEYPKLYIEELYRALFLDKFPKDLSGCPLVAAYRPWEPYIFNEALGSTEKYEEPSGSNEANNQTNTTSNGGEGGGEYGGGNDGEDGGGTGGEYGGGNGGEDGGGNYGEDGGGHGEEEDYVVYGADHDSESDGQAGSEEVRLNGIEYKMIQTIGERLHISIEMQVENTNLYHLFQQLIDGDIEMVVGGIDEDPSISQFVSSTIPYHQDDLTWCVAKAQHTHKLFNFMTTFESGAWILTLLFILTASLSILLSCRFLELRLSFLQSYFSINIYVMGIILSQAVNLRPIPTCLKLCFGTTFFMALMFSNVYQSFLVSTLTTPKSSYQISHLHEIYQNRMHIMGSVDNVRHLNKEGEIYRYVREQFQMCYNIEECLQRTATDAKLAVAISRQHSFYNPRIPRDQLFCFDRNENIYVYLVTMLMPKKFHLLHKINPVIQYIIESGHMQKWARDLDMRRKISEEIQKAREEKFKSLTLPQVAGSFALQAILLIFATYIFALERLAHWLVVKRKTRLKLAKMCHRKLV